jgi:hypothetical protein
MEQRAAPGEPKGGGPAGMPPRRIWMGFLAILLVNFLVMRLFFPRTEAITVPYTAFKAEVAKGNVESIYSQGESIEGRFAKPVTWPPKSRSHDPSRGPRPPSRPPYPRSSTPGSRRSWSSTASRSARSRFSPVARGPLSSTASVPPSC